MRSVRLEDPGSVPAVKAALKALTGNLSVSTTVTTPAHWEPTIVTVDGLKYEDCRFSYKGGGFCSGLKIHGRTLDDKEYVAEFTLDDSYAMIEDGELTLVVNEISTGF